MGKLFAVYVSKDFNFCEGGIVVGYQKSKIVNLGLVLKYAVVIHSCIMISLTKLISEIVYVISNSQPANGRRFSSLIAAEGRFMRRNVYNSATEIPY